MGASPAAPLASLVVSASKAAQSAQRKLDDQLVYGPPVGRAIPRVTVEGQYGIRKVAGKTLLVFGDKREEMEVYGIGFTVELAQEPMPSIDNAEMPATALNVPPFVEHPAVVRQLVSELSAQLIAMDPRLFSDELKALSAAAASKDDDPGLVAFRLPPPGDAYLIARIGGKPDGIFLLDRSPTPRVTVFNHAKVDRKAVSWLPFQRLFEALRAWQRNATSLRRLDGPTPAHVGAIDVNEFLTAVWNAYREARHLLATTAGEPAPALPAHYVLGNMTATLTYSVPRVISKNPDPDADPPLVRSDLTISVRAEAAQPVIDLRLQAPEYVLVGGQKQGVLQLLRSNLDADLDALGHDSFFAVIDPAFQADYELALRDPARAAEALALLSYQDQPPKNEFLFVWRGTIDSEERDFAFRFQFDGEKLVKPELVKRLEDPDTATVPYHKNAAALHDFFHAAWIWTMIGGWFPG